MITTASLPISHRSLVRISPLGSGSFGHVSLALDLDSCTLFAVKTAVVDSRQQLASLQNEFSILQQLSSPHIVRCLGATRRGDGHEACLFLEYVDGGSLADLIQRQRQSSRAIGDKVALLDEQRVRSITRGILQGLCYLHNQAGVVHCDIKSHNILLDSTTGSVKIADFGTAKRVSSSRIPVPCTNFTGTPLWMAPEVLLGMEQGPPSDIWSVGCTLVEMIQGTPPWYTSNKPTSPELAALILEIACSTADVPLPEAISPEAQDFLRKCLHRDPKQRWTAYQLLKHPFLQSCHKTEEDKDHFISSPRSVLHTVTFCSSDQELLVLPSIAGSTGIVCPSSFLSRFSDQPTPSNSSANSTASPNSFINPADHTWLTVRRLDGCARLRTCNRWQDRLDEDSLLNFRKGCEVDFQSAAFLRRSGDRRS